MKLLTISNHKTTKGESRGYLTGILYLAPHKLSGHNMCLFATKGCIASCLNTAGRGAFNSVQTARLKKTKWLTSDRKGFILQLLQDIEALIRKASREGLTPVVRLNGTSDLRWELIAPELFATYPELQFYDYTKYPLDKRNKLPKNYHLTYSANEELTADRMHAELLQRNVAVVVSNTEYKEQLLADKNIIAIDGDQDDLRFLDPSHNTLVILTAKGRARKDTSGFVLR